MRAKSGSAFVAGLVLLVSLHGYGQHVSKTYSHTFKLDEVQPEILQDDAQELIEQRAKVAEQMGKLNPFQAGGPATGEPTAVSEPGGTPPLIPPQLQWVLKHPAVAVRAEKLVQLMQEPKFQNNAMAVVYSPNLKWLYVGLGLVLMIYVIVSRRALAATDRLWLRVVLRLVLSPVLFGSMLLVGYAVLRQPFIEMIWAIAKTMA